MRRKHIHPDMSTEELHFHVRAIVAQEEAEQAVFEQIMTRMVETEADEIEVGERRFSVEDVTDLSLEDILYGAILFQKQIDAIEALDAGMVVVIEGLGVVTRTV